ncbi:MAG: thioesterase family protein [Candidatus Pelagadaptatus aseana]|uniref:acyl-CoA thioesterase n=1 Tax=Candidatus Pelagadaptatus aseana TaxID=3120508 RepID=UPI0039B20462
MNYAWDYPSPFTFLKHVPGDVIDGLEHVNNAAYVAWCEEVAWQHSQSLGLGLKEYQELDRAMAIRHSEFDYCAATYEGEELLVATWITQSDGRLNMERRFQIIRAGTGEVVLRARWQLVCIEISSGKPKRLPKLFRDVYGSALVMDQ